MYFYFIVNLNPKCMLLKNALFCSSLLLGSFITSNAQTFVPPNMDFESGTTANWAYFKGTVAMGHVFSFTPSSAVPGLHTLMSGSGVDAYGGFPVVGSGSYSLKLSHDTIDNNADAASYAIHVPVGGAYTLNYSYAAVLEDTVHAPGEQPIMKMVAVDSASGTVLSDSLQLYPTSPGFTVASGTDVFYIPWTSATIDLSGYGGHTVIVTFAVAGCSLGAHLGYGYIDVDHVSYSPTVSTNTPVLPAVEKSAIRISPSPTSGNLNIKWEGQQTGFADLAVTDVTGRVVIQSSLNIATTSGAAQVNFGSLANGIYFINIKSESINYCDKVVIQK